MAKTIKQTIIFKGTPKEVYDYLADAKKHTKLIGDKVKMTAKAGDRFTAYGGAVEGQNLVLEPGAKIIQTWRYEDWPKGHYSTAIYEFKKAGKNTVLNFTQISVPDDKAADIAQGWKDYYWEPLKKLLDR